MQTAFRPSGASEGMMQLADWRGSSETDCWARGMAAIEAETLCSKQECTCCFSLRWLKEGTMPPPSAGRQRGICEEFSATAWTGGGRFCTSSNGTSNMPVSAISFSIASISIGTNADMFS